MALGSAFYNSSNNICGNSIDKFGCPSNQCPDFIIKRHDNMPPFKVEFDSCDDSLDLEDETLVVEASMWANAKLKKDITDSQDYIELMDGVGFYQVQIGDVILMNRVRGYEYLSVTGFDETNKRIYVTRGHASTLAQAWKKNTELKIFKFMNSAASISLVLEDVVSEDGTVERDKVTKRLLNYNFTASDTCLPGCYYLEFKIIKFGVSEETTTISGCGLGSGILWIRRIPLEGEGFLVKIVDSFTPEA